MDYQSEILIALVTTKPRRASRAGEMIPMSHCVNGKREPEEKQRKRARRTERGDEGITCQRNVKHISNVCIEQLVFITRVERPGRSGGSARFTEQNAS